jgi:hypothetical protein
MSNFGDKQNEIRTACCQIVNRVVLVLDLLKVDTVC